MNLPWTQQPPDEDLGDCLSCVVRAITGVQTITEKPLAVRMTGSVMLLPQALCQVEVNVPSSSYTGPAMLKTGLGPWGLCMVRRVTDTNPTQPKLEIPTRQVVALVERVTDALGQDRRTEEGSN